MKTALIVDITNLYFNTQTKFGTYRINYQRYLDELTSQGLNLTHMFAYSKQRIEQVQNFATVMKNLGFQTKFGADWEIEMALQLARVSNQIECFVLGSSNIALHKLLVFANERGISCRCNAVTIPPFFRDVAKCKELDISFMDYVEHGTKDSTKQMELRPNFNGYAAESGARHNY